MCKRVRMNIGDMLRVAAVLQCFYAVSSLVAYDCEDGLRNYTSVSLLDLPSCEYKKISPNQTTTDGFIVQSVRHLPIQVRYCRVVYYRLVHNCDFWGSSEASSADSVEWPIEITRSDCMFMWRDREFHPPYGSKIGNLNLNDTNIVSVTVAGETDSRGKCKGSNYRDPWDSYSNVVVTATYTIKLIERTGILDVSNSKVILSGDLGCLASTSQCRDGEKGLYIWELPETSMCSFSFFRSIYQGPIVIMEYNLTNDRTYKYAILSDEKNYITTRLVSKSVYCNVEAWTTNIDNVMVLLPQHFTHVHIESGVPSIDVSLNLQYLVKLTGMDLHLAQQLNDLYANMVYNDCILERSVLQVKLHVGLTDPLEFAYIYNNGPGSTAVAAGEAVYVAKCSPVEVYLNETTSCHKEIPVKYRNRTMFMNPRSRVLQPHGSPIACSSLFPSLFREGSVWYSVYPVLHAVDSPKPYLGSLKVDWSYNSMSEIISGGLYSQKEIENAKSVIFQPYSENAVASTWTMQSMGSGFDKNGININNMIEVERFTSWFNERIAQIFGFAHTVGNIATVCMGFYIIYAAICYLLELLINGNTLYQMFGLSWKLVIALFRGAAGAFISYVQHHRHVLVRRHVDAHMRDNVNRRSSNPFVHSDTARIETFSAGSSETCVPLVKINERCVGDSSRDATATSPPENSLYPRINVNKL